MALDALFLLVNGVEGVRYVAMDADFAKEMVMSQSGEGMGIFEMKVFKAFTPVHTGWSLSKGNPAQMIAAIEQHRREDGEFKCGCRHSYFDQGLGPRSKVVRSHDLKGGVCNLPKGASS